MVCPTGVRIAEINARARAQMVEQGHVPFRTRMRNNLLARPDTLGKYGQPIAPLSNIVLMSRPGRWLAELSLGFSSKTSWPPFTRQKFSSWVNKRKPDTDRTAGKVVYFHGCTNEYYEPRVGKAAIHVLEANGFEVVVPPQDCCGLPLLSNGEFAAARKYHDRNIRNLIDYVKSGYAVVGTSTSCTLTLKEEAPDMLDNHSDEAQLLASNTYDFHEFLTILLDEGRLRTEEMRPIPMTLAYHAPCQYRAHRIGLPSLEIMDLIPELRIIESRAVCCGIGGTYGYKREKYQIAMDVGQSLFDFVLDVGGPVAVCDSETCRWQITHGTGVPAVHPVELLAAAYGFEPEGPLAEVLAV
jgi:glycerol-3-phosphate dehydrogenase subunit C